MQPRKLLEGNKLIKCMFPGWITLDQFCAKRRIFSLFRIPVGAKIFLSSTSSIPDLGPTKLVFPGGYGDQGVKLIVHLPTSVEVKNTWI
jgi:hypothetical protein